MSTTTKRRGAASQARKAALESDYTPLYAVAGLTDAVAEGFKTVVVHTQEKAGQRLTELQTKRAEAEKQARSTAGDLRTFVRTLPEQVKALPETTKARILEFQQQAAGLWSEASTTYAELAGRGKRVVDETVGAARQLGGKAEERAEHVRTDVTDAVVETIDPAFEAVQETVTRARQTVTGKTATETVTPRSAAKASATRKANTEAEAAKKEAAVKKAAATRAAKKGPARKAPAKTAAAKTAAAT